MLSSIPVLLSTILAYLHSIHFVKDQNRSLPICRLGFSFFRFRFQSLFRLQIFALTFRSVFDQYRFASFHLSFHFQRQEQFLIILGLLLALTLKSVPLSFSGFAVLSIAAFPFPHSQDSKR